jgi:hypothetical protein
MIRHLMVVNVISGCAMLVAGQRSAANHFVLEICIDRVITIPSEEPRLPPIVPGCEIVDCCPGCPGPGPLDWRVRIAGDPVARLSLRFDNLPATTRNQLQLDDRDAGRVEGDRVEIRGRSATLSGLSARYDGRPPVAYPTIEWDQDALKKLEAKANGTQLKEDIAQQDAGRVDISIEQLLGNIVVSEYKLAIILKFCPRPTRCDEIELQNNTGNDSAVLFIDGRRTGGCVNDEIRRDTTTVCVGNLLSRQVCRSEVAVFSDDNAMALVENVNVWSDSIGDRLTIPLQPILNAPVTVWLLDPNAAARAAADLANANLLYNVNHAGVQYAATVNDRSTNNTAINLVGTSTANMCQTAWIAGLTGSAFFTPGQVNIYYVNGAFTGLNCIAVRNIIVVGTTANNQTLAHELGHACSLSHTNGNSAFGSNNVMIGGGAARDHFSEGQDFRINMNPGSVLNANGVRTGPTRTCSDATTNNSCPALGLDATPN